MKVFSGLIFGGRGMRDQVSTIVAAKSRAAAGRILHLPDSEMRNYWSETGNKKSLEVALAAPGQVFMASSIMSEDFAPVRLDGHLWVEIKEKS
jgi:hypothetical protein